MLGSREGLSMEAQEQRRNANHICQGLRFLE
jgi:hypothetical protein